MAPCVAWVAGAGAVAKGPIVTDRTPKQQRFVDEYLIDLNATQAYIRAGYRRARSEAVGCATAQKS